MKFRPMQDRVLIRRIEEEEKTKGGIIIPDTGTEIKIDGEDFVVAKESDIMGVVEEAASQKAA
jgi:chaperonin GroES